MPEAADGLADIRAFMKHRGPRCAMCRIADTMSDGDADKLRRALASHDITDKAVADWVASLGFAWMVEDPKGCVRHHRQQGHLQVPVHEVGSQDQAHTLDVARDG